MYISYYHDVVVYSLSVTLDKTYGRHYKLLSVFIRITEYNEAI